MSPRRLSIRARLTAAFVAALAVVLALAGLFVYLRTGSELSGAIDDGLEVRAADLAALVAAGGPDSQELTGTLFEGEEGFSEILTTDGRVVASTLGDGAGTALDPATLAQATQGAARLDGVEVPGLDGDARILAEPANSPGGDTFVVVAGASTGDRGEALAGIAGAFLVGAPLALALAGVLGYLLATRALAPVESLRRRADAITLERSRRAPAAAGGRGRAPSPGRDAERDARPDRGFARARARLRRRCEPRAAHPAGHPPRRARARAPSRAHAGPAARGARFGKRGGRPALEARGGPAGDRARRPGPPADQARTGGAERAADAGEPALRPAGPGCRTHDLDRGRTRGEGQRGRDPGRAGAREPDRQRAAPRCRRGPADGEPAGRARPYRGQRRRPGVRGRLRCGGIRALQQGRRGAHRRRRRPRPRDRQGDRRRARGPGLGGALRRHRRHRAGRVAAGRDGDGASRGQSSRTPESSVARR